MKTVQIVTSHNVSQLFKSHIIAQLSIAEFV